MSQYTTSTERIDVKGEHLIGKVKELIHEGNVRRIVINDAEGKPVLDMPVTVGVIGLLVAPTLTAVGTLGALASHYSIDVERGQADRQTVDGRGGRRPLRAVVDDDGDVGARAAHVVGDDVPQAGDFRDHRRAEHAAGRPGEDEARG